MNNLRRVFAIFLCFLFGLTSVLFVSNAGVSDYSTDDRKYPIIIVPGYSSSSMYKVTDGNQKERIWRITPNDVLSRLANNAVEVSFGLVRLAGGNYKALSDRVGVEFLDMCGDMAYDEDGKPVAELHCYHTSAAEVSTAYLNKNEGGKYVHEIEIMPYVTQDLGAMAEEWTFNFATDFRQNIIFCATDLARLVKDVKQQTGQDQVNLVAVSHGGQISATYLSLCVIAARGGDAAEELAAHLGMTVQELTELFDADDIHNAVLNVPAIGGALLAYDVLTDSIVFDEETLMFYFENGLTLETECNRLFKSQPLGIFDKMLHCFYPYMMQVLGHWGSIWDFVPLDSYEAVKEKVASKRFLQSDVIRQSDYFHASIMSCMADNLQSAEQLGVNVYIIAGSGLPSIVGTQETSDTIISVNASTGATVAPLNERFSDGYQTLNTQCSDPTHNHLSPAMNIDLSTGYLPETTWIVNRLFHGMMFKDDYVRNLLKTLVESDIRVTVRDKAEYPQFHESTNVCESVYAEFDTSQPGFVGKNDKALTIRNLCEGSTMIIRSVTSSDPNVTFDKQGAGRSIAPKGKISLSYTGSFQAKETKTVDVTVSYFLLGSVTPANQKTFTFTVTNN